MIKSAQKRFFRGFTLIELLIVIAILGILAAAVLVAVNPTKRSNQARDAGRKSDIGQIATALQAYSTTPGAGAYPQTLGTSQNVTMLTVLTASGDLKRIPNDPIATNSYTYTSSAAAQNEAAVYATLEAPTAANGFWCWRSGTGTATEVTNSSLCTAP